VDSEEASSNSATHRPPRPGSILIGRLRPATGALPAAVQPDRLRPPVQAADSDDLLPVLANYWHQLGLLLDPGDDNDVETVSAVVRITGGNFRLIERLMTEVDRVMDINQLDTQLTHNSPPPQQRRGAAKSPLPQEGGSPTNRRHRRSRPGREASGSAEHRPGSSRLAIRLRCAQP
jgi:hypothetical protein